MSCGLYPGYLPQSLCRREHLPRGQHFRSGSHNAANDGFGATLVLCAEPCSFCAALFLSLTSWLLTCCFQAVITLIPQRLVPAAVSAFFLCDVESDRRGLKVALVVSVRLVQRACLLSEDASDVALWMNLLSVSPLP
jgi:hypothetical protein